MISLRKRAKNLTTLFDIEAGQTMVYCDNPSNCESYVPIGRMLREKYLYLNLDEGQKDFCCTECLLDWCLYALDDGGEYDE